MHIDESRKKNEYDCDSLFFATGNNSLMMRNTTMMFLDEDETIAGTTGGTMISNA